ncbi:MAG: hypothetical protein APR54_03905 [Candidatus Cloacimonas sp. SDB]|nr:MAG: hypothetical protein APR54_03905 [Candidatus Cloacimonas sp. SDB]
MSNQNWIDIKWFNYPDAPKAILEIPITIDDIDEIQYLQLDTGCPNSLLFGYQLSNLFGGAFTEDKSSVKIKGKIGDQNLSDLSFKILKNVGKKRANSGQKKIGLLGTDFFVNKVLIIDFIEDKILISDSAEVLENLEYSFSFSDMSRNPANVIVLEILINDKKLPKILYDTGTSIYDFTLNDKSEWESLVGDVDKSKLDVSTIANPSGVYKKYGYQIEGSLQVGDFKYLNPFLYYRDTDLWDESPLNGTLGNKPFFQSCVLIDFINFRFGVSY